MSALAHYAVVGSPVDHSLSPQLFGWLFSQLGIRARYSREATRSEDLPKVVGRLRAGEWDGLSVTLPHKEAVCALVEELDSRASQVGASNCLVRLSSGRLRGCNTDGPGLRLALQLGGSRALKGARLLLLGAGGAARAAAFEAAWQGASELTIANRSVERAKRLAADLVGSGCAQESPDGSSLPSSEKAAEAAGSLSNRCAISAVPLELVPVSRALREADIVVNSTSVGLLQPGQNPLPANCHLRTGQTVLDMVYRPLETALLKRATAEGATVVDGLWMLVYQALEQLRLWTGQVCPSEIGQRAHRQLMGEVD